MVQSLLVEPLVVEPLVVQEQQVFLPWYEALQDLAVKNDMRWLVSDNSNEHLISFEKGLTPEEELAELENIVQWRGCGCGA